MKLSDLTKYQENPFVEKAIVKIEENTVQKKRFVKGSKGVEQSVINKDGEVTGHTAFLQLIEVDEDKFAKLYLSQFAAFWDLPKSAIRVFGYLLSVLLPKSDRIYVNTKEALQYTDYKHKQSIFDGLTSLCEHGLIARSEAPYMYFINPLIFFNGDRVTFAKTYVKKRTKKLKEDKQQQKMPFWDETIEQSTDFD